MLEFISRIRGIKFSSGKVPQVNCTRLCLVLLHFAAVFTYVNMLSRLPKSFSHNIYTIFTPSLKPLRFVIHQYSKFFDILRPRDISGLAYQMKSCFHLTS